MITLSAGRSYYNTNGVSCMALRFEIDQAEYDKLDESQQALYDKRGDGYRLQVEGIDPADELKEALRKEREERAAAKKRLQEFETENERRERERLEKQQEWEQLSKTERERAEKLERELNDMRDAIANEKRNAAASKVASDLTRDTARARLLQKEAMQHITYTPEGVKINGPDGDAWDAAKLTEHLKATYPFLVDGSGATGGGAAGSNKSGGAVKRFNEYSGAELKSIKDSDPALYDRLKTEYYGN